MECASCVLLCFNNPNPSPTVPANCVAFFFFIIGKLRLKCGTSREEESRDNQDRQGLRITHTLITGLLKCMFLFIYFLGKKGAKKKNFIFMADVSESSAGISLKMAVPKS